MFFINSSNFSCNRYFQLFKYIDLVKGFRVRSHVMEMKSHPGMKKFLFTREFHPRMKRVEFHPRMKFNLKQNLPLSMKTYNKIYHFSQLLKSEAWYVKNRQLKARCIKWLRLNVWCLQLYQKEDSGTGVFLVIFVKFVRTPFLRNTSGRLLLYYAEEED